MSKARQNKSICSPSEFKLKSYFLAPNAENRSEIINGTKIIYDEWFNWRHLANLEDGPFFSRAEMQDKLYRREVIRLSKELKVLSSMFSKEIPRHSPRYVGHMYSEYTIPAFFGHLIALMYNPNNISAESSRVGTFIEIKAVNALKKMLKLSKKSLGHFTSGGTVANFEMLYRAKLLAQSFPKKSKYALFVPESAHYSWKKGIQLIGGENFCLYKIKLDRKGRLDTKILSDHLDNLEDDVGVMGIVSVMGSTEIGAVDPVAEVQIIAQKFSKIFGYKIWHHVDAAYGGFISSVFSGYKSSSSKNSEIEKALIGVAAADSVTLDPHKLGYAPYSTGCFICQNPHLYRLTNMNAPYLDYKDVDYGLFTLEGSRTAAGPLSVYLTSKTLGLDKDGLGLVLKRSLRSANVLQGELKKSGFLILDACDLNIVCFVDLAAVNTLAQLNRNTEKLFKKMKLHPEYFVSKTILSSGHEKLIEHQCRKWNVKKNVNELFLIRCTVMNPFFNTAHARTNFARDFSSWAKELTLSD